MKRCNFSPCKCSDYVISEVDYFIFTDPPEIFVHPETGPNTEGNNVVLSCDARGRPFPTISWTRDGSPVDSRDSSRISFSADKKQLTITNVNRTDSGEYRCVASNELGNDTSKAATLDVRCKNGVVLLKLVRSIHCQRQSFYVLAVELYWN